MKCYIALTERAEDFQLKITFTKYHKDIEGREQVEMGQMTTVSNNEPLRSPRWQTRLIRGRTHNNVLLKPGSILYKVSGTKAPDILCGELRICCCWLYLQCGPSQLPGQGVHMQTLARVEKRGRSEWNHGEDRVKHNLGFYKKLCSTLGIANHRVWCWHFTLAVLGFEGASFEEETMGRAETHVFC